MAHRVFLSFWLHLSSLNPFILSTYRSCFWNNSYYFFMNSHDEKVACEMIMDKKGMKGYQVILISPCDLSWWCYYVVIGWVETRKPFPDRLPWGQLIPVWNLDQGNVGLDKITTRGWWSQSPSGFLILFHYSVTTVRLPVPSSHALLNTYVNHE